MWMFTKIGFVSIVKHDKDATHMVRFRIKADAVKICKLLRDATGLPCRIAQTPKHDYPFRTTVPSKKLPVVFAALSATVDYGNFKAAATPDHDTPRAQTYLGVWADMQRLQDNPAPDEPKENRFVEQKPFDYWSRLS